MVSEEARVANEEAAKVKAIEKECNDDLAVAMPMLQDAIKALDTLSQKDISEVCPRKLDPKCFCAQWKVQIRTRTKAKSGARLVWVGF